MSCRHLKVIGLKFSSGSICADCHKLLDEWDVIRGICEELQDLRRKVDAIVDRVTEVPGHPNVRRELAIDPPNLELDFEKGDY